MHMHIGSRPEKESRRGVMLEPRIQEAVAMISRRPRGGNKGNNNWRLAESRKQSNKDGLWCTYYYKPRHTHENYFKQHGKAQVLAQTGGFKGQVNVVNKEQSLTSDTTQLDKEEPTEFNQEDIGRLRRLLESLDKPSGCCSLARVVCFS